MDAGTPVSPPPPTPLLDALMPPEMARKAEQIGVNKARLPLLTTFTLSLLAGAFIALGAMFATTVAAGAGALPYGVARLLVGTVFALGLILVVVGGAELFTGNNLIVMAWVSRRVTLGELLRNWAVVYAGNFVGSVLTALLVFAGGQYAFGGGAVGQAALATAATKTNLGFGQALALGVLCNALVCLAVWLTYGGRSATDKVLCIVPPVAAFVAAGFEHSVANMYFVPLGLMIKEWAPAVFWTMANSSPAAFPGLTVEAFLLGNLLPVTIGNIGGGGVLVGLVYWVAYLRPVAPAAEHAPSAGRVAAAGAAR